MEYLLHYLIDFLYDVTEKPRVFCKEEINLTNNILRILTIIIPILHEPAIQHLTKKILWDVDVPNYSF